MFVSVPTAHDPAQARAGQHTALLWHFVPRVLRGRAWKDVRETFMATCVDRLRRYAPNVGASTVIAAAAMSPDDHVAKFPNLASGVFGGRNSGGQLGAFRPIPELAGYRTPIGGLYLAGASMHPGGNITGANGYNAAAVICRDLGIEPWWKPADPASHWEALATGAPTTGAAAHIPDRAVV